MPPSLLLSLGMSVIAAAAFVYSVAGGLPNLMAGSLVAAVAAVWPLGARWRPVPLVVYLAGFLVYAVTAAQKPDALSWLGALLLVLGMFSLDLYTRSLQTRGDELANVVLALEQGGAALARARDWDTLVAASIKTLEQLHVAPNLAFIAYRDGAPHILGARGAFSAFLNRPLLPDGGDSRSVQADHWVVDQVAALLPLEERGYPLALPVSGHSGVQIGSLLLTRQNRPFTPSETAVVTAFSRLFGTALGQWQAIKELRDANNLTLNALGSALEHRDDETGGHTARVESLSLRLARRLSWSEGQLQSLKWGAYLHDLGKVAIPDAILHKPGVLTPEERLIIQRHTVLGYDMLQDLHFLPAETLDLVRYHHERWDGTGYPAGLRGKDIPETARLFSIVDVYDALTSQRPYKTPWPRERALAEIRLQAGRQFDPQYTEAFVHMMTEQDEARLVY